MTEGQDPFQAFKSIYNDHGKLCSVRGEDSEADTRANIIDRLLRDVLGWPDTTITREKYAQSGYLDYEITLGKPKLIIEAKRQGKSFRFPHNKKPRRHLKISGVISSNKEAISALVQAHSYCIDRGCPYGVATNGYTFVIFKAFVNGQAWRDRDAVVFHSPKDIESDFTLFMDLLSYEGVKAGHLADAFRTEASRQRQFHRPLAMRYDRDAPYGRNPLNASLRPHVDTFFGDIASLDDTSILHACYVDSNPIHIIDKDLTLIINDRVPFFAQEATQIQTTSKQPGGEFHQAISTAINRNTSANVVVLMGGIGSGKSTFLKRFFRIVAPELTASNGPVLLLHLDFIGAPDKRPELADFLWSRLCERIQEEIPASVNHNILTALFAKELKLVSQIYANDPHRCESMSNDRLFALASNPRTFSEAVLKHFSLFKRFPLCVFDNVDQLSTEAQIDIFTTAQDFARTYNVLCVLVLREESYSAAQMQKHLTADTINPYHLSSPDVRELMKKRIDYAITDLKSKSQPTLLSQEANRQQDIVDLFELLRKSFFDQTRNRNIIRLIHALSFGNTRLALHFLREFITSGAVDMRKILTKYRDTGNYRVPFHEFAKAVTLSEYRYYSESRSSVLNIFDVTNTRNSSHFTTLRILRYLLQGKSFHSEEQGFRKLNTLISDISSEFNNEEDCVQQILRLIAVRRQLVELDTGRTDTLAGARQVRLTSAGQYYLLYLINSFSYLDLVWHDTPFNDETICRDLSNTMSNTLMTDRFCRVEKFLSYLEKEEQEEISSVISPTDHPNYLGPFMPRIRRKYEIEKKHISNKLGIASASQGN